jgi:hypothetical protein
VRREMEFNIAVNKMLSVELFHTDEGYFTGWAVVSNLFGESLGYFGKMISG